MTPEEKKMIQNILSTQEMLLVCVEYLHKRVKVLEKLHKSKLPFKQGT